jgi:2-keto-4-pentenoate hydratase/2-oxohepta-3-ene-1,7-dioic acid hydratase in catechol pathway
LSKSKLLKIGDRVDITIEGCGTLVNTIVADGSARGQP